MVLTAKDFFPMIPDRQYIYQGFGNEFLSYTTFTDYTNNTKQQLRISNGATEIVRVYEYTPSGVRLILQKPETYYRENFLSKPNVLEEYIIKNPIQVGTNWSLLDGSVREITNINQTIKTPLTTYTSVLEITTTNGNSKSLDYYVKDLGLIKSVYFIDDETLSSEIKQIKYNTPLVQSINFFYPDKFINSTWYVSKNIKFYANDITKDRFKTEFVTPINGLIRCIGPNTTINWLYYNEIDKMVHLDFSSNFVSDLNAGSSYEALCLSSITNTIGYYYNCNKVYITLNGEPYSSGHIEKQIGEPFLTQPLIGPFGLKEWKISNCVYPITYVVKTGDTLSNIAKDYCTNYQNLANLNNIENTNLIYPNQILQICPSNLYTVKAGDTLSKIAIKFGTSYQEIARVNNISNPNIIYVGQILIIPCTAPSKKIYTVKQGDILSEIAINFGTTVKHLVTINNISDPDLIFVGQLLLIE